MDATLSQAFNGNGFNRIVPFSHGALDARVQSDHAEIGIKMTSGCILNLWNISNPKHHKNFEYGALPPFKNTHLYVKEPFNNGNLDPSLLAKIEDQIEVIAKRFDTDKVHVQVIVEGYESFFNQLAEKINQIGIEIFEIISLVNHKNKPENWDNYSNMTGILVNGNCFTILDRDVVHLKYKEEADEGKEKELYIPYVHLEDNRNRTVVIAGVHIPGCTSQRPKTGLKMIAEQMHEFFFKTLGKSDIIMIGDFNTSPQFCQEDLLSYLKIPAKLFQPEYLTHVNPKSEAAKYDLAVIACHDDYYMKAYKPLPITAMSKSSQALVSSIVPMGDKNEGESQKLDVLN